MENTQINDNRTTQAEYQAQYLEYQRNLLKYFEKYPLKLGKFLFPHHFRDKSPWFHHQIMEKVLNNRFVIIAAPRQSAKSTIIAFLYTFYCILYRKKRFIVLVGNTEAKAKEHLDAIKKELVDNKRLKNIFPPISLLKDSEVDTVFKIGDNFQCRVLCKGVEQIPKVRGEKFGAYRPDLILGDDLEDDELVRSKERRIKLKEDFDTALMPAGDFKTCQYIIIGTILHDDSQLSKILTDVYPNFHGYIYRALSKDDTESIWSEMWTAQDLKKLRKENPTKFAKEYQNDPVSGQNTRFSKDDFRYWKINGKVAVLLGDGGLPERQYDLSDTKAAISCDLAWETRKEADQAVILAGLLTPHNDILVYSYVAERGLRPDRFCELIFPLIQKLETITGGNVPVGFEKAMLEKAVKWFFKKEMRERNKFVITKPLQWGSDKITRIETKLQPRYANHTIYHQTGMGDLEFQLTRFPYGTHDDLCDALSGIIQLLKNPKSLDKKKVQIEDEGFEWWQKFANKKHTFQKKKPFIFGKKNKHFEVPHTITFR
jgi:hypothetical protein